MSLMSQRLKSLLAGMEVISFKCDDVEKMFDGQKRTGLKIEVLALDPEVEQKEEEYPIRVKEPNGYLNY